jgi:hypothetical protein
MSDPITSTLPPAVEVDSQRTHPQWHDGPGKDIPNRLVVIEDGEHVFNLDSATALVNQAETVAGYANWLTLSEAEWNLDGGIVLGFPYTQRYTGNPRSTLRLALEAFELVALKLDLNLEIRVHNAPDIPKNAAFLSEECNGVVVAIDVVLGEYVKYANHLYELNYASRQSYAVNFLNGRNHTLPSAALVTGTVLRGSMSVKVREPKIEEILLLNRTSPDEQDDLDPTCYALSAKPSL